MKVFDEEERGIAMEFREKVSTVLEQDHFYSVYLVSHVTVLTNSQNRDDEVTSHAEYQVRTVQALLRRGIAATMRIYEFFRVGRV